MTGLVGMWFERSMRHAVCPLQEVAENHTTKHHGCIHSCAEKQILTLLRLNQCTEILRSYVIFVLFF